MAPCHSEFDICPQTIMFFKATFSDYIDFRDKGIRNFFEYETGVYILYTFEYIGNMKYIV